ncbi:MAG: hypothetical protein IJ397_06215 [Lachnospiraceae bacterium]|nr:hypothetical protein [Lachnospiraceae bacterium]
MESARRYQSSSTQRSRFALQDYNGKRNKNDLSMSHDNLGETEPEVTKETAAYKNEETHKIVWEEKIATLKKSNITLRETSASTAAQFHYYSTRYIFMLLFGERAGNIYEEDMFAEDWNGEMKGQPATLEFMPMKQVSFTREGCYEETENVLYRSKGMVTTADGREINFNLELGMSRSFREYYEEEYDIAELQRVCDPLVINFAGNVANLTDQKFFFDIDADGKKDEISELASGSGYLALDKNNDGTINDGSELFGPQSGDGFGDLAEYDEDGNGWIDENDSVWNKLKIWCRNEKGENELYTLAEKGVGAICLQKAVTDFALKNADNSDKGFIRSTGIFLYENGNVGSVQHLDLAQ